MKPLYVADLDRTKRHVREKAGTEPQLWLCPCDGPNCKTIVVYARASSGIVWFTNTVSFQPEPPYPMFGIENVEDFHALLTDKNVNSDDRGFYALLLGLGLRDALLNAP